MAQTKEEILTKQEDITLRGLRQVLSTEEGRAWYFNLIGKCGVFRSDTLEVNHMFFEAGKKNLGIMLLGEAELIDKDLFMKMQIEAINRKKELENGSSNTTETSTDKHSGTVDISGYV